LRETLGREVGEDQIFMDLKIDPGDDFVDEIESAVGRCRVLLAIIGPQWANVADEDGAPRLHDPQDFVALEVGAALRRDDVRVIPVLVNEARMPRQGDLPDALGALLRRQAHELSYSRWQSDVKALADVLERVGGVVPVRAELEDVVRDASEDAPEDSAPDGLVAALRAGGIVDPAATISAAKQAGLPLPLACALLDKESDGGHNVFGQQPTIFVGAGEVTQEKYDEYKRERVESGNRLMQGVGPCQLTWWQFQDAADEAGGCWQPEINMRIGFNQLAQLVRRYGEVDGTRRFNGSGPAAEEWGRDVVWRAGNWKARL
jgi:hypothetical protein